MIPLAYRGVSLIRWHNIRTFAGFEDHLRAFTNIKRANFTRCGIFCSFDEVRRLALLGSNLTALEIRGAVATPAIMASLRVYFPGLRKLLVKDLQFEGDDPLAPGTPLLDGLDHMSITLSHGRRRPIRLDWISPTAQFTRLEIGAPCVYEYPEVVNGWIASSAETLKHFSINGDFDRTAPCDTLLLLFAGLDQYNLFHRPHCYPSGFLPLHITCNSEAPPFSQELWKVCQHFAILNLFLPSFQSLPENRGDGSH